MLKVVAGTYEGTTVTEHDQSLEVSEMDVGLRGSFGGLGGAQGAVG